ncbi:type IV toxin-antitoxin system YeeU family antitoxin [Pectobacterium polaris]|uniref:type IV toxin-antitoxin system YeeU family antitoxin n=1 Tax=Pectobacterium polaris TaxID=2042057 RepID=UPI0023B02E27|nr:type IV toxin-antitoxin system YeeU family antitoxin [Pectobacterium polaris]MDE8756509.1 type IV toxin-antitoxin system YeeU family antitoxin [Pectobacterium polaris]
MSSTETPEWGLKRAVTPRFGARLVQEDNRLHYLADRASIDGTFSKTEAQSLERCFPELIKLLEQKLRTGELTFSKTEAQSLERCFPELIKLLEQKLRTGELNPRQQGSIILHCNEWTCEADTLGSFGYVYIVIYPSSAAA